MFTARARAGRGLWLWLALLTALSAQAHVGGLTGYAQLQVQDNAVRYTLTLSALPSALLEVHGGDETRALDAVRDALQTRLAITDAAGACVVAAASATPPTAARLSVSVIVDFACPAPVTALLLVDDAFDVLGADLHVLGRASRGERVREFTLAAEARRAAVDFGTPPAAATSAAARGFVDFVKLGVEHILIGYDHLLFLLALLIAGGSLGTIIRIVTAFTVAHSITLALTVLDVLRLPPMLVEAVIAASIAYVAAENLWARNPLSRRVWVTALFGLVHGCGFAAVLREIGLPTAGLWPPLVGFNVGVELGQLAVIAVLVPVLRAIARAPRARSIMAALSVLVCGIGLWLFAVRTVFA